MWTYNDQEITQETLRSLEEFAERAYREASVWEEMYDELFRENTQLQKRLDSLQAQLESQRQQKRKDEKFARQTAPGRRRLRIRVED